MIFLAFLQTTPALPASSSPSQLLLNLPACFYLPVWFSSLGFAKAYFLFAANLMRLVLSQSSSHGETGWTSTRREVGVVARTDQHRGLQGLC